MPGRLGPLPLLALALAGVAGCGPGAAAYADAIKEKLALQEEETGVLRTVKDEASMAKARERLKELAREEARLEGRLKDLPPPTGATRERLEREFGPRLLEAQQDRQAEIARILGLPGGPQFFEGLRGFSGTAPAPPGGR
jgi:hypothetical protein